MLRGFLLGLANSSACLAGCAPVLLPMLLGEGEPVLKNSLRLVQFLSGRLLGYLLFVCAVWAAGGSIRPVLQHPAALGALHLLLALLLLLYGFAPRPAPCLAESARSSLSRLASRFPALVPPFLGFLTGLSVCPPFMAAMVDASRLPGLLPTLTFFLAFFFGTSLAFLPLPLAGLLRRHQTLRTVGRLASGLMGGYYLYTGAILLYGGLCR